MTWAPGPVVTRRRLGGELKRLREQSGLKLDEVAYRLECSPSKISRLENGKGIPKVRDVRDMLDAYGIPEGEKRDRLLQWSRTGQAPMWWQGYLDVMPRSMATYVELEWDAARLRAYEPHLVHGLLQTREYARAVLENAYAATRGAGDIERLIDVRMRRQETLFSDHGLTFTCVLDESTLHRAVGSPQILRDQLTHLIGIALAEHVDVRVLPFSAGLVPGSRAPFATLGFSAGIDDGLVYLERSDGADVLAERVEVAAHERLFQGLLDASLTEPESVPLMERALERVTSA